MDFTPADITNQLQNTTFLTNVFMTSFLAALSVEGIKTIIGYNMTTIPYISISQQMSHNKDSTVIKYLEQQNNQSVHLAPGLRSQARGLMMWKGGGRPRASLGTSDISNLKSPSSVSNTLIRSKCCLIWSLFWSYFS